MGLLLPSQCRLGWFAGARLGSDGSVLLGSDGGNQFGFSGWDDGLGRGRGERLGCDDGNLLCDSGGCTAAADNLNLEEVASADSWGGCDRLGSSTNRCGSGGHTATRRRTLADNWSN